jgi:Flp pilus assembly protein TadG
MRRRSQHGGTLVEAALILLLAFTFIFAIIEFGRVLSVYQTMTDAAREGARFAVAPCQSADAGQTSCSYAGNTYQAGTFPPPGAIVAYVTNYLNSNAIQLNPNASPPDTVTTYGTFQNFSGTVNGKSFETAQYRYRTVTVTAHYQWLLLPFGSLPLKATAVMRDEGDITP